MNFQVQVMAPWMCSIMFTIQMSQEIILFQRCNLSKPTVLSVLSWNLKKSLLGSKSFF